MENPFASIEGMKTVNVQPGTKLIDIINSNIEQRYHKYVTVFVNDLSFPDWENYITQDGDRIDIILCPLGTGDAKDNLRSALQIVVAVGSLYVASLGGIGYALAGLGISVVGSLLINELLPVVPPPAVESKMDSPTYQISGTQNQANPWGSIPVILGVMRVSPYFAAQGYMESSRSHVVNSSTTQRYIGLYIWGYGSNCDTPKNIRVGKDPISSSIYFNTVLNVSQLRHYQGSVISTPYNLELPHNEVKEFRTENMTGSDRMTVAIDLLFSGGLFEYNNKGKSVQATASFGIEYKKTTSNIWQKIGGYLDVVGSSLYVFSYSRRADGSGHTHHEGSDENGSYVDDVVNLNNFLIALMSNGRIVGGVGLSIMGGDFIGRVSLGVNLRTGVVTQQYTDHRTELQKQNNWFTPNIRVDKRYINGMEYGAIYYDFTAGVILSDDATFSNNIPNPLTYTIKLENIESGQYDIRIKKISKDIERGSNKAVIQNISSRTGEKPINFKYPLMLSELSAEASKQVNGQINTLNGILKSISRAPNPNNLWIIEKATSNPASLIVSVLQSQANPRPVSDDQIDWDNFTQFYNHCERGGLSEKQYNALSQSDKTKVVPFAYNRYHNDKMDLQKVLSDIAAAGRGYIGQPDGRYYIYFDHADKPVTQLFNNDNIVKGSFEARRIFTQLPHAIRCTFKNELNDWETDEMIVYMDGYSQKNATLFESMDFPYTTNSELIYKTTREYMKAAILRNEIYTFQVPHDVLRSKRRDVVQIASDVIMVGLSYGRISGIGDAQIRLLDAVYFEEGKQYIIEVRIPDGEKYRIIKLDVSPISPINGFTNIISCDTSELGVGFTYTFTEKSKSYECIITSIVINEELHATVTCVPYAPEIYAKASDTVPDHTPVIDIESQKPLLKPAKPYFIEPLTETLIKDSNGIVATVSVGWDNDISPVNIKGYEIQYQPPQATSWVSLNELTIQKTATINGYEYGRYIFRVRSISDFLLTSDWTEITANLKGVLMPLPDVMNLTTRLQADYKQILMWDYVNDFRDVVYEVRRGDNWLDSEFIVITDQNYIPLNYNGHYWVKARVKGQNVYSANPTGLTAQSPNLIQQNVIKKHEEAPVWSGDKVFCAVEKGRLVFNASEQDSTYAIYTIPKERIITLASKGSCHIAMDFSVVTSTDYNFFPVSNIYTLENVYGRASEDFKVTPQVSIDGGGWENFYAGLYYGESFNFRLYIEADLTIDVEVLSFNYSVDVPDRVETHYNELIEGHKIITFSPPFNEPPTVVVNILNAEPGDTVILSDTTKSSINIKLENGAKASIAKNVNIVVQGY